MLIYVRFHAGLVMQYIIYRFICVHRVIRYKISARVKALISFIRSAEGMMLIHLVIRTQLTIYRTGRLVHCRFRFLFPQRVHLNIATCPLPRLGLPQGIVNHPKQIQSVLTIVQVQLIRVTRLMALGNITPDIDTQSLARMPNRTNFQYRLHRSVIFRTRVLDQFHLGDILRA